MYQKNVMKTRELNLCVSCQICEAICPKNCISMEYDLGQFLPKINMDCIDCGLCIKICPGIDPDPLGMIYEKKITETELAGNIVDSYTAYSKNSRIRQISTSGGIITTLVVELIKNKEFDAAFVLPFDSYKNEPVQLKAVNQIDEILNSAKSKYIPASVYNVITELDKHSNKKYIIVGTPCQILGIKKYIIHKKIATEDTLFLGLFCDKTLNMNIIKYFEDLYKNPKEKLKKIEFRTKEKYGWPGNLKLYFNNGRELFVDKNERMSLKLFFQLNRCLFCYDKLNMFADISFGDCYIRGKEDFNGKSNVIVRTEKGSKILEKYSYLFDAEKEKIEEIRKSQHLIDKIKNIENVKILQNKYKIYSKATGKLDTNYEAEARLFKLQKNIEWGMNYNKNKIKFYLFLSKVILIIKKIKKIIISAIILGSTILKDIFFTLFKNKVKNIGDLPKRNVIIVGGELFNKGAQAMTFITVDQIKSKFPSLEIYLFSTRDFERDENEKKKYNFNILPWDSEIKLKILKAFGKSYHKDNSSKILDEISKTLVNADMIIDISGYALSSQWGFFASLDYLINIIIAKKYSISYYIFPQSLGPFNYPLEQKFFLYPLMKLYLRYPKKIYAREMEGLKCVRRISKRNVDISKDMVLLNKGYEISNIYKEKVPLKDIRIEPNSIGVIPNLRVVERLGSEKAYLLYKLIIDKLVDQGKTVYLVRHSYEDLQICQIIKDLYFDNKTIKLISDDFSVLELESIIKQFDFVIASRFHSIIHSYKSGTPAIVIGWAVKYLELVECFDQMDYFFDIRKEIDLNNLENGLEKMINCYEVESNKIISILTTLNDENIFEEITVDYNQRYPKKEIVDFYAHSNERKL